MRGHVLLVAASVALLAFAPAPLPRKERGGLDQFDVDGTWEFVECDSDGRPYLSTRDNYHAVITKEAFCFTPKSGGAGTTYVMHLDPRASPPSFTWSEGKQVSFVGSYRLENGRLTMIFTSGDRLSSRPTDFSGRPAWRYELRRIRL